MTEHARPIERVGVIVHAGREGAVAVGQELIGWLRERGIATRSLETEQIGAD